MSLATKIAIVAHLEGDALFCSLLASDPDAPDKPALFNAQKSLAPPVYPCVTFREADGAPVSQFRPALPRLDAAQTPTARVDDEYFDFEIWTQEADSAIQQAILDRLDAQLRDVAFPISGGRVFYSQRQMSQLDLYDKTLNVWFALVRYRFRVERA